jgi:hypothetical protein
MGSLNTDRELATRRRGECNKGHWKKMEICICMTRYVNKWKMMIMHKTDTEINANG